MSLINSQQQHLCHPIIRPCLQYVMVLSMRFYGDCPGMGSDYSVEWMESGYPDDRPSGGSHRASNHHGKKAESGDDTKDFPISSVNTILNKVILPIVPIGYPGLLFCLEFC